MSKSNISCPACGRKRKPSHEKRCGTPKAYHPECQKYEGLNKKEWREKIKSMKVEAVIAPESKETITQETQETQE